jgi:hypothetical protein
VIKAATAMNLQILFSLRSFQKTVYV